MKETILSLEQAAMERWRKGDPFGFVELSAADISYVDPGQTKPILGLEEYRAYMQQIEGKVHYQRSEFIEPKVVVAGDAALLSYNYRSSVLAPEGKVVSQTPWNTTEVYFWREGVWKIVHTHWSFIQPWLPESVEVPIPVQLEHKEYEGVLGELMALNQVQWNAGARATPGGSSRSAPPT